MTGAAAESDGSCAARRDIETVVVGRPSGTEGARSPHVEPFGCRAVNLAATPGDPSCGFSR